MKQCKKIVGVMLIIFLLFCMLKESYAIPATYYALNEQFKSALKESITSNVKQYCQTEEEANKKISNLGLDTTVVNNIYQRVQEIFNENSDYTAENYKENVEFEKKISWIEEGKEIGFKIIVEVDNNYKQVGFYTESLKEEPKDKPTKPEVKPIEKDDPTLGGIIGGGDDFLNTGRNEEEKISSAELKKISDTIYNILLVLGIVLAVVIGTVLGIKFMTEGVEGQADVKKALVPYGIGCIVVFGAFTIWKIVVDILQSM